jgi:hypothetical protein
MTITININWKLFRKDYSKLSLIKLGLGSGRETLKLIKFELTF